jgi:glyoxylase-like metal-dependent hydrolase (beta-lactamase superfamily II)
MQSNGLDPTADHGGYTVDVIVSGYPGKAVCHGGLGWSTIVLLRGHGRVALVDVGTFGMRNLLITGLARRGLTPADVTDVILTHSHHDHSINWVLFSHARIVIGAVEMAWSVKEPWGETPVPELYVEKLQHWPTTECVAAGAEVLPGMTAHLAPGHTPGCLVYRLRGTGHDVIFTGDAAKNRAELVSGDTDMTYDPSVSAASIDLVWTLWRERQDSIVIPGHDLPMRQLDGVITYIGQREAAIRAWYGDSMEQTTLIDLVLP